MARARARCAESCVCPRPGYATFRGERLDGAALLALLEGLTANGLVANAYSHLLTGYIGSLSFLRAIAAVAAALRAANPGLLYGACLPRARSAQRIVAAVACTDTRARSFTRAPVCDPVLGDAGKLYVPAELVEAYRTEIVPLASVVTPNQFEAEQLTQRAVRTAADALAACDALHALGPPTVVITSMDVEGDPGHLSLFGSTRLAQAAGQPARFRLRVPKREGYFTGAGDLTAALLLARDARAPGRLAEAVEAAVASVQGVLQRTAAFAAAPGAPPPPACAELRLVQSAGDITAPTVVYKAEPLP